MQSVGRDTAQQNHQCQVARNELALGGSSACCDWPCFALHLPVCTTGAVPQSFGAVQGNGRLPPIAAAALANMSVTEQHSFEGAYAVYKTLPRGASSQPARRQIPMLELPAVSAGSAVAVLVCR
eukprot:m.1139661 g.1139661  ORF g.1139661 m.1139661 type:complete len:124 (-) comp24441_c0_seq110:1382-1753(-)